MCGYCFCFIGYHHKLLFSPFLGDDTLILSGVRKDKIKWFSPNNRDIFTTPNDDYILMTRYTLQTEIRNIFNTNERSVLFAPWIYNEWKKKKLLNKVRMQYNDKNAKLKKKNTVKLEGESESDTINRLLQDNMVPISKMCFRLTLIDEAHFLRNLSSYWGIGVSLKALYVVHLDKRIQSISTPIIYVILF